MVFGVLACALVKAGLDEGFAGALLAGLLVFVSISTRDFVNSLAAANTAIVGMVSAAVVIANSALRIPYPVLSSQSGTSMSLAVFRRMFLICW